MSKEDNAATKQFLTDLKQSVAQAKTQPETWAEELQERQAWEATLADGLKEEDAQDKKC